MNTISKKQNFLNSNNSAKEIADEGISLLSFIIMFLLVCLVYSVAGHFLNVCFQGLLYEKIWSDVKISSGIELEIKYMLLGAMSIGIPLGGYVMFHLLTNGIFPDNKKKENKFQFWSKEASNFFWKQILPEIDAPEERGTFFFKTNKLGTRLAYIFLFLNLYLWPMLCFLPFFIVFAILFIMFSSE